MEEQLLTNASKSVKTLIELKNFAVKIGNYDLGAKCRELEKELFPETEEELQAKQTGKELNELFSMVNLNIDPKICVTIFRTLDVYKKKKNKFDIKDASKIRCEIDKLFLR
jgi:hypothetical protein